MARKQFRGRKPETQGNGKVTPRQIAYIVDRYLCDNNFPSTRSSFRNEASSLISNSPIHEVPKTLLTLGEMLEEYICLKEQKVMLDQERVLMEQEKNRVQMLLHGMQNVMNFYNASGNLPPPAAKSAIDAIPPPIYINNSQPGVPTSVQSKPNSLSLPQSSNTNGEGGNLPTSMIIVSNRKRKDTKAPEAPSAAKKSRARSSSKKVPLQVQGQNAPKQPANAVDNQIVAQPSSTIRSSPENCVANGLQDQGSNIAKGLFNQSLLPAPTNSHVVAKTPPRATSSHCATHISPSEISSFVTSNSEATPARCTVISTKRVMVSPAKQMAYIEMSHCISPIKTGSGMASKRDHVRSRLDFDAHDTFDSLDNTLPSEVSTSESEKELDFFDMDFYNLDALGIDFISEMLNDLEAPCEGIDFPWNPTSSPSIENVSGPSQECNNNGSNVFHELSNVAEVRCEEDLTAMRSVTKSITVISHEQPTVSGT